MSYQQSLFEVDLRCNNCDTDLERWKETPQGRKYCPQCGSVKADEQRDPIHRMRGELP